MERSTLDSATGCLEWQGSLDRKGYGKLWAVVDGRKRLIGAHRYAWILANGSIPDGLVVMHKCDNPQCVSVDHLALGTQLENIHDALAKGRHSAGIGERHRSAKLTEAQVLAIRADPRRECDIARAYGVAPCTINGIRSRNKWKHLL